LQLLSKITVAQRMRVKMRVRKRRSIRRSIKRIRKRRWIQCSRLLCSRNRSRKIKSSVRRRRNSKKWMN